MSFTLTSHGHATFTLDTGQHKLVIDPFFAPNNPVADIDVSSAEADYILITHGHGDHIADAIKLAKQTGATCVSNFEINEWLMNQGAENAHPMHIGGGNDFAFGHLKLTIAHHGSMLPDGANGGNPAGLLITLKDDKRIYIAGDTALTYDMKLIGESGGVDLAVLPIGDNFTMGPHDAVIAARFCGARHVIPCHYDTWPLIEQNDRTFADDLLDKTGISSTLLKAGDSYQG